MVQYWGTNEQVRLYLGEFPLRRSLFMDWITQPETWIAFLTLVALELVLGVDNVIFISILAGKLPEAQQGRARRTGIMLAVITRVLLLISLRWMISLESPLFR